MQVAELYELFDQVSHGCEVYIEQPENIVVQNQADYRSINPGMRE